MMLPNTLSSIDKWGVRVSAKSLLVPFVLEVKQPRIIMVIGSLEELKKARVDVNALCKGKQLPIMFSMPLSSQIRRKMIRSNGHLY